MLSNSILVITGTVVLAGLALLDDSPTAQITAPSATAEVTRTQKAGLPPGKSRHPIELRRRETEE